MKVSGTSEVGLGLGLPMGKNVRYEGHRMRKADPDPALPGELDPSTNTLKRDGKLILDESDSYGVEMALQLVDAAGGGEVRSSQWLQTTKCQECEPLSQWAQRRVSWCLTQLSQAQMP